MVGAVIGPWSPSDGSGAAIVPLEGPAIARPGVHLGAISPRHTDIPRGGPPHTLTPSTITPRTTTMERILTRLQRMAIPAVTSAYVIQVWSKDVDEYGADSIQEDNTLPSEWSSSKGPSIHPTTPSWSLRKNGSSISTHLPTISHCESSDPQRRRFAIQRSRTLRVLSNTAKKHTLSSLYHVDWDQQPIGSGAFGHVLLATHKQSGDRVALKRIPKKLASREDFQREMEALLRIQKWGGHPHICALREHFDEGGYYYLILDLIEGGESEYLSGDRSIVVENRSCPHDTHPVF